MSSITLLRLATRIPPSNLLRSRLPVKGGGPLAFVGCGRSLSTSVPRAVDKDGQEASTSHHEESFEEFTARYGTIVMTSGLVRGMFCPSLELG